MGICAKGDISHTSQQLLNGWLASQIRAQCQLIHEEPDQWLDLDHIPVGNVSTDNHVVFAGILVEEYLKHRKQGHKHGYPVFAVQELQRFKPNPRETECLVGSPVRLHSGSGSVCV